MPPLIHHLTHPGELTASAVVCGAPDAALATWERARVTCPACQRPCTCGPGVPLCPACAAWNRTQRGRPTVPPGALKTEKGFQEAVRQLAGAAGWRYYHVHDSRHSPAGFPDTVCVQGVRLLLAELKMSGKRPTAAQQAWLEALGQVSQVETYLWYPADLPTIVEVLQ